MDSKEDHLSHALKLMAGVATCILIAATSSLFLGGKGEIRIAALVLSFLAVTNTAILVGRLSAILGALSAAIVFYIWLFPPIGGITLEEPAAAGTSLIAFLLLSASVAAIAKRAVAEPYRIRVKRDH